MTSRGGVKEADAEGFLLRPLCRLPKTQAARGPTAHNTAVSRCQQHPWPCLCSAHEAAAYVAGPRYRFQAVAPATVFVRRLNQPRCVTQPSAEQRIRPAPRSSHG